MPLISVIIPVHNAARWIEKSIASVLAQTLQDFEIIVVDDASTDESPAIVLSFKDKRIRFIRLETNSGPSVARNAGIGAATGELIAFLDADDLWLPRKLDLQVQVFRSNPGTGIVYCGVHVIDQNSQWLRQIHVGEPWPPPGDDAFERVARRKNFIVAPFSTMVVQRTCFDEVGVFDPAIVQGEEWDLAFLIAHKWKIDFVAEPLALYRMSDCFLPQKRLNRSIDEAYQITIERAFSRIEDNSRWRRLRSELVVESLWLQALYWYALREPFRAIAALEQIVEQSPDFLNFARVQLVESTAYVAWDLYDSITPIREALAFLDYVFAKLPPFVKRSAGDCRRMRAYVCKICAFDSYPRCEVRRVWEGTARAVIYDPRSLANVGLLKLPVKTLASRLLSSRDSIECAQATDLSVCSDSVWDFSGRGMN